jgi:hypothetical protein
MATKRLSLTSIAVLSLVLAAASVCAQEEAEEPKIESWVEKVIKDTGEYLSNAEEFSFHAKITFESVMPKGEKLQFTASQDVIVKRPDKVRSRYVGDLRKTDFWYDGENVTVFNADKNIYAVTKVPSNIDEAMDHVMEKYNLSVPIADLIYSEPHKIFMEKVETGYYVGLHQAGGVLCHHMAFQQENVDWQIWIEEGKRFLPKKFIIDYKTLPGSPQYTVVLSDWDFSTKISDSIFEFEAPEGAEEMEFFPIKDAYQKTTAEEEHS